MSIPTAIIHTLYSIFHRAASIATCVIDTCGAVAAIAQVVVDGLIAVAHRSVLPIIHAPFGLRAAHNSALVSC